jgi:cystathionine beta-lyase family protein involved in aluminum resistance
MDLEGLVREAEVICKNKIEEIRGIAKKNELKVLDAFRKAKVDEYTVSFRGTGYGYNDRGREMLSKVFSHSLGAESAIVLPQIVSGTHAISSVFFSLLRPKDTILSLTGPVYDTLKDVLDALKDWGIRYQEIPFEYKSDTDYIKSFVKEIPKIIFIQRSCGYNWSRKSLTVEEVKNLVYNIKGVFRESIIVVDNCYGEFIEEKEPLEGGVDIIIGSLIKGIGGNLAPAGSYIAGKKDLLNIIGERITAPGQGIEIGPTLGLQREILQGLLFAPHFVAESLKGLTVGAYLLEKLGFDVLPRWDEKRGDAVQRVILMDEEKLVKFLQGIQSACPVNSHYKPEPQNLPGYDAPVILAGGGFVQGSTGEFSADGILKPPYVAFIQGGYSSNQVVDGIIRGIEKIFKEGK